MNNCSSGLGAGCRSGPARAGHCTHPGLWWAQGHMLGTHWHHCRGVLTPATPRHHQHSQGRTADQDIGAMDTQGNTQGDTQGDTQLDTMDTQLEAGLKEQLEAEMDAEVIDKVEDELETQSEAEVDTEVETQAETHEEEVTQQGDSEEDTEHDTQMDTEAEAQVRSLEVTPDSSQEDTEGESLEDTHKEAANKEENGQDEDQVTEEDSEQQIVDVHDSEDEVFEDGGDSGAAELGGEGDTPSKGTCPCH